MTDEEIRARGLEILSRELGPLGLIRFLQQFDKGHGDYLLERRQWVEKESLEDLLAELRQTRQAKDQG
jgi:hypothetical protein